MKINGNVSLNTDGSSEFQNVFIERLNALPSGTTSLEKGRIVFLTTTSLFYFFDGSAWTPVSTGGNAAALQTEIDQLEAALGSLVDSSGNYNAGALTGTLGSSTSVTDVFSKLQTLVANEVSRATAAEGAITTAYQAADATLTTDLAAEVNRATAAEGALTTAYQNGDATVTSAFQAADAAITSAYQAADATLTTGLSNEVTRATAAEGVLTTNLTAEVTRATAAEGVIAAGLAQEIADRGTAIQTLTDNFDAKLAGLTWKNSVKAMATSAVTMSGPQTVDGVSLVAGDRVLVNVSPATPTNGIYVVAAGAWARSTDMDSSTPINEFNSAAVFVEQGTVYADTSWTEVLNVTTIGTDNVSFTQFDATKALVAGAGLLMTGNVVDITADDTSITVSANGISVSATYTAEVDAKVSAEATRATAAEGVLTTDLANEVTRATAAEGTLTTNLAGEVSRATAAEGTLTTNLAGEVSRATAAEGAITTAYQAADTTINNRISAMYFLYTGTSATSHTVTHNLGQKYCNVTVVDSTDEVVIPQSIVFNSTTQLTVTFTSAIACKVIVMGLA